MIDEREAAYIFRKVKFFYEKEEFKGLSGRISDLNLYHVYISLTLGREKGKSLSLVILERFGNSKNVENYGENFYTLVSELKTMERIYESYKEKI